jgi:hypothetical protein
MNPRKRAALQLLVVVAVAALLLFLFPATFRFVEMAAREIRYLWWLVLIAALAVWLIWGTGRRRK